MADNRVIRPSKAPNLPVGPVDYTQRYQDQLLNILRLYFNTIDNNWGAVLSSNGGSYFNFPHIAASDTTDQLATATDTPTLVLWNVLESSNGFTLNPSGSATAAYPGVYKITYSLQLVNTDNVAHDATVWLRVNGVDVVRSATVFTVPARKSAGVYSYVCGYSEAVFSVQVGDDIELYWATDQAYDTSPATDGIYIEAIPAQASPYARPAIPSAIGSITFVSSTGT